MAGKPASIPSLSEVVPYYQPIVSLQTRRIYGYEALGRRLAKDERVESLGPFFADMSINEKLHLQVDRHLRMQSIRRMSRTDGDVALFLNLRPSWIYSAFRELGELRTLAMLDQTGLDPRRIVIEITEEEFSGPLHELTEILQLYREKGCTIAIDDIGSGYSNFDRIALLRPKIMKIDLKIMKKSAEHSGYRALLQSFSILAEQIGASLLIEGIETKDDLRGALQAGARYVQGYLFAKAEADLREADAYEELLNGEIGLFAQEAIQRQEQLYALQEELSALLQQSAEAGEPMEAAAVLGFEAVDRVVERLLPGLPPQSRRVYVCREDGCQVSSNFSRSESVRWLREPQYRGSNWSWRPYFISNIMMMKRQRKGTLSQVYTDLDTSLPIQTFSCPCGERHYLFVDVGGA